MATNITELRELLRPRSYPADPPGAPRKSDQLQTPSDRMRDTLYDAGRIIFGLVPDARFQEMLSALLHDIAVTGEQTLCRMHQVETEHAELKLLQPLEEPEAESEQDEDDEQTPAVESEADAKPKAVRKPKRKKN